MKGDAMHLWCSLVSLRFRVNSDRQSANTPSLRCNSLHSSDKQSSFVADKPPSGNSHPDTLVRVSLLCGAQCIAVYFRFIALRLCRVVSSTTLMWVVQNIWMLAYKYFEALIAASREARHNHKGWISVFVNPLKHRKFPVPRFIDNNVLTVLYVLFLDRMT